MGIKVTDIAFVRFVAPDLDRMEAFLVDFGMQRAERTEDTLFMRGTDDEGFVHVTHRGDDAAFLGLAFNASSDRDLDALASLDDASDVTDLDGPGGGRVVSFTDPNGFGVEVVSSRGSVGRLPVERVPVLNDATGNPRKGIEQRVMASPSTVKRLGHAVLNVADFGESEAWYKERFGLVTSDQIDLESGRILGAFLRCDLGDTYVDHHTLFLVGSRKAEFNHAAFEVASFDDLMAGHTHLTTNDHAHNWGIGRHILGGQIYDYWKDPWGHVVEHWTDGDLFNHDSPPRSSTIESLLGSQWGPTHTAPA